MRLLRRLNSPIGFAIALMVFVALNGFLFYRYQQSLQSTGDDEPANAPVEQTSPSAAEETTSPTVEEQDDMINPETGERYTVWVLVTVVNKPVGLNVRVNGRVVHDEVTYPGFVEEFEGDESVVVRATAGSAVNVQVNDEEPERMGTTDKSAQRIFTPERAREMEAER